ncbi:MAG: PEP-CTERM sorting domain-containing protein [bacterium]|nr:PEP-CTERM sorting domain-containing protein [bacterium]
MTRMICVSIFLLLLTLSASAEDVHLQAAVPGEAGTIALRVTLDEAPPAVLENSSGIGPDAPLAVPEPATLGLLGLGVLGLLISKRWRDARKGS